MDFDLSYQKEPHRMEMSPLWWTLFVDNERHYLFPFYYWVFSYKLLTCSE